MIDFDKRIFNIDIPCGPPSVGSLLVSEPFLKEDYFHHTVICIADYAPDSTAMGIVLNRQTSYTLQNLINEATIQEPVPVYCGGPMAYDRLFFLHTLGDIIPHSRLITQNLYVGGDFKSILDYVNQGYPLEGYVRFFIGYSGWSRMQLDEEINNKVWAVTESSDSTALLTGSEDTYWHRYVRLLGNRFRGWRYHPRNPHAN